MSLRTVVRECITDLNSCSTGHEVKIGKVIVKLKTAGAIRNIHVGKKDFTPEETLEWYAGQILDVLESGELHCVNSIANAVDSFIPL